MVNIIASPYEIGDILKLKDAGATSVIIGTPFFSVRALSHFTNTELKEVKKICETNHLQMYVLMNRFFVEDEVEKMKQQLLFLKELDVDGIYFTDMGVFYEAKRIDLHDRLIYNPDTILTNHEDVNAYLDLGMKMCTLGKEITLEDMVSIGNNVSKEMEVIIHGRLNMMHSKRNLLTNYMEFLQKDKNFKNNHDLYLMEENRDEHMPILEDEHGTHIFTGFTLCSFEEIADLFKAGIRNFRVESMFMKIDEVVQAIKDYHKVIENPAGGRKMFQKYQNQYPQMNITKGFLYKKTGLLK